MDKFLKTVLFSCIFASVFGSSYAQNCSNYLFSNNNVYSTCTTLPVLNSFLHWTYHQTNHTVDIAYQHTRVASSQWVAWALNIERSGMDGAQSLVAFRNSSGLAHAYTSPVAGYGTQLEQGTLSFNVPRISAEFSNSDMIIHATLELPVGSSSFNQVWQIGPVSGDRPGRHASDAANLNSVGTVDFISGLISSNNGGNSRQRKRNVHGVLNVGSWGILMPIGAMAARYLKVFKSADPAWFYLHIACQSSAYVVGLAGWATGLKLGSDSTGIQYNTHRIIGITLFCLASLQVFAILLRPNKDNKYIFYWNIYHYAIGYSLIILSIVNIFEGFDILDPKKKWKKAYIAVLIFLGFNTTMLEAFTWYINPIWNRLFFTTSTL